MKPFNLVTANSPTLTDESIVSDLPLIAQTAIARLLGIDPMVAHLPGFGTVLAQYQVSVSYTENDIMSAYEAGYDDALTFATIQPGNGYPAAYLQEINKMKGI